MKLTRRQFIKTAGTAGAGAVLLGVALDFRALAPLSAAPSPDGGEKWVASGCNGCVGWCPLMVKVVDGKAVKIKGNPNSKWTRGKLCPRGLLNLQILYDPDRVKRPLKRTNPKKGRDEDPRWVEINWEEALKKVPFVAHHTTHISEWSIYADIVLPAKTYLEKWSWP